MLHLGGPSEAEAFRVSLSHEAFLNPSPRTLATHSSEHHASRVLTAPSVSFYKT